MAATRLRLITEERYKAWKFGSIKIRYGELCRQMSLADARLDASDRGEKSAAYLALKEMLGEGNFVLCEVRDERGRNEPGEANPDVPARTIDVYWQSYPQETVWTRINTSFGRRTRYTAAHAIFGRMGRTLNTAPRKPTIARRQNIFGAAPT